MMRGKRCILILSACLAMAGCGGKEGAREAAAPAVVTGVPTEVVAAAAIPDGSEAVGTVRARNAAVIAARLAGTVSGVFVREG